MHFSYGTSLVAVAAVLSSLNSLSFVSAQVTSTLAAPAIPEPSTILAELEKLLDSDANKLNHTTLHNGTATYKNNTRTATPPQPSLDGSSDNQISTGGGSGQGAGDSSGGGNGALENGGGENSGTGNGGGSSSTSGPSGDGAGTLGNLTTPTQNRTTPLRKR